ncbi:thermonuclease family protein [Gemmatimonas aurantiaca]|nr:thermonuclease family protein [Gemmatimonas aurantiaca]
MAEEITPDLSPADRFRVVRALDGDTVELAGGDRLRLLYIDTPERGELFSDSARIMVERLTLGKSVLLTYGSRKRDGYGRLLAMIESDSAGIPININQRLLEKGYAHIYLFRDNLSDESQSGPIERMVAAQRRALVAGLGIWSLEKTQEPRYLTTKRSLRFHRESCRSVADRPSEKLRLFATRREPLWEGLSPCRNCRP